MRKLRTLTIAVTIGLLLTFSGCSSASDTSKPIDEIGSSVFEDETTVAFTTEEPIIEEPTTVEPTTEKVTEKATEKPKEKTADLYEESSKTNATIEFTDVSSSVSAGSFANVSIHGAPNTTYSITVVYNSGISTANGLEDITSDSNGNASWSWKVGSRTKSGTYPITVSGGGQSESTSFTVY